MPCNKKRMKSVSKVRSIIKAAAVKTKRQKLVVSESDSSDDEQLDLEPSYDTEQRCSVLEQRAFEVGMWVLVKYECGQRVKEKFFVGQNKKEK